MRVQVGVVIIASIVFGGYLLFSQGGQKESFSLESNTKESVIIASDIGRFKYSDENKENECRNMTSIQSSECEMYGAKYYLPEDFEEIKQNASSTRDVIEIEISIHTGIEGSILNTISEYFTQGKISPIEIQNKRIYAGYSIIGSSYYWVSGNSEVLVGAFSFCGPGGLDNIKNTRKLYENDVSEEDIRKLEDLCVAFDVVRDAYLEKYPSSI